MEASPKAPDGDFYRHHLGVKSSTCTATVLAEVGDYSMEQAALIRTARFYTRITTMPSSRLPKQALNLLKQEACRIQCSPAATEAQRAHERKTMKQFWHLRYNDWTARWNLPLKMVPDEQEEVRRAYLATKWMQQATTMDMMFYKYNIRPEPVYNMARYLSVGLSRRDITQLARFRLWNTPIRVITDQENLPRAQRLCKKCPEREIDDEYHMVFGCTALQTERQHFPETCCTENLATNGGTVPPTATSTHR